MLNVEQVMGLRSRLETGGRVDHVDGLPLQELRDCPPDWGETIAVEAASQLDFRPPDFVLGEPEDSACLDGVQQPAKLDVPAKTVRRFGKARIIGWRSLVSESGLYCSSKVFLDAAGSMRALAKVKYDGFIVHDEGLRYLDAGVQRMRLRGNTLFLTALEPENYGSFVFRALPKLLYFLEQGMVIDQIVVPDKTLAIMAVLALLGLGQVPVYSVRESVVLEFDHVFTVDDFELNGGMCAASMTRLRSLAGTPGRHQKIYVSRRLNAHRAMRRPLLSEVEIETALAKRGFTLVYPESLHFAQQLSLFAGARYIVGPSGSGMLNSLFSAPDCRVLDVESFTSTVRQHARIYSSAGHRYAFAFGRFDPTDQREQRHLRRWSVSPALVLEGLDRLIESR